MSGGVQILACAHCGKSDMLPLSLALVAWVLRSRRGELVPLADLWAAADPALENGSTFIRVIIMRLRKRGYVIETVYGDGYRLIAAPDDDAVAA